MQRQGRVRHRRSALRFEIVGVMRGSIVTSEPLDIRNIGLGGALVHAPWPLRENSVHTVRLELASTSATFDARVCHVRRSQPAGSYVIGFEFIAVDALTLADLEVFLSRPDGESAAPVTH